MTFAPPPPPTGSVLLVVRADEVRVGDRFIPMEGPGLPVGAGRTWRICNNVIAVGGSLAIEWGNDHRWYHPHNDVHVARPSAE